VLLLLLVLLFLLLGLIINGIGIVFLIRIGGGVAHWWY
jgi:hypothetical protein